MTGEDRDEGFPRNPRSILIKNALTLKKNRVDVYIENGVISEMKNRDRGEKIGVEADFVVDASDKIVMPGLVNTHTHAAMTLLRGYADDMELQPWLEKKIWPAEARLTPELVYWGTRLACLEMIKTGTLIFNDMYFYMEEVAKAVEDCGMKALLGYGMIDLFSEEKREEEIKKTEDFVSFVKNLGSPRIKAAVAPHAIYTVSDEGLRWCAEFAEEKDLAIHIHVSETRKEVEDSIAKYGESPVRHLHKLGVLTPKTVAAHSVWLDDTDIRIYRQSGVWPSHSPVSNMKLAVGKNMPYREMRSAGIKPTLGTDGTASNNNLDMFESMKFAALLQKLGGNPTVLPAEETVEMATEWGAMALGFKSGILGEGYPADIILLDTQRPEMTPLHNPFSLVVYSASGSVVDTAICDGQILMYKRAVPGEKEVLEKASLAAKKMLSGN